MCIEQATSGGGGVGMAADMEMGEGTEGWGDDAELVLDDGKYLFIFSVNWRTISTFTIA